MSEERLKLWKRTIQLFHDSKPHRWRSPFKRAGFHGYSVEPRLSKQGSNPDLVAASEDAWVVLELTLDEDEDKTTKAREYMTLDGNLLPTWGLPRLTKPPSSVIIVRMSTGAEANPTLIVQDKLDFVNREMCLPTELRRELENAVGRDLRHAHQLGFTLVPESKGREVRKGLVPVLLELFEPGHLGYTEEEMMNLALERLSALVSSKGKHHLRRQISLAVAALISDKRLGQVFLRRDDRLTVNREKNLQPQRMRSVTSMIESWASESLVQTQL